MKIDSQAIPPELAEAYAKLISRKPTGAGQIFSARTKPRALKKAPVRKPRGLQHSIEEAVDFLITYLTKKDGHPPALGFRAAQIAALKRGTFDPNYWVECAEASSTILENTPTSGAFVGIRNYAYPDPANQPSAPTYGVGVPATGDPAYTGWTTGGVFRDTGLRWVRKVFTLANSFTRGQAEPLFLKLEGNITANADMRPSRAMISAIIKRWIVSDGSARLTTTEAPVIKPISALWRYRTPHGVAPYFALTKPLKLLHAARSLDYEEQSGTLTSAVVLVAPMPMMGKRYNNNTSVTSTIAATVELWQISKSACAAAGAIKYEYSPMVTIYENDTCGVVELSIGRYPRLFIPTGYTAMVITHNNLLFLTDRKLQIFTQLSVAGLDTTPVGWSLKTPTGWAILTIPGQPSYVWETIFLDDNFNLVERAQDNFSEPTRGNLGSSKATNGNVWLWQNAGSGEWFWKDNTGQVGGTIQWFRKIELLLQLASGVFFVAAVNSNTFGFSPRQDAILYKITWGSLIVTIVSTPIIPTQGLAKCAGGFMIFGDTDIYVYTEITNSWSWLSANNGSGVMYGQSFCADYPPPAEYTSDPDC